jgi:ATP-dependent DNA helicase RecG
MHPKREEKFMKHKETQNVEFKQSWRDEFLKEICGFANAQGGKLLIGVDDSGKAVGVANGKRLMEDIPNKIVSLLGIVPDVNLVDKNGVEIIVIVVSPSSVPILYHGVCYYRSGTTKQELTGVALQQFILKKLGRSWDDVRNDYATLKDIDRNAIRYFIEKAKLANRIDVKTQGTKVEQVLESLGLID